MNNFLVVILIAGAISLFFTVLLDRYYKKNRLIKYLPSALTFLFGVTCIIISVWTSAEFKDLGYMILAMINFIVSLLSLFVAIIIDIIRLKEKK